MLNLTLNQIANQVLNRVPNRVLNRIPNEVSNRMENGIYISGCALVGCVDVEECDSMVECRQVQRVDGDEDEHIQLPDAETCWFGRERGSEC